VAQRVTVLEVPKPEAYPRLMFGESGRTRGTGLNLKRHYLARSWPSIISVPELESLCLFSATYGKEPGDLVPPRIHVACPPARGQEGSGRVHGRVPEKGSASGPEANVAWA